ncbi:reverse transcriptase domain-containing protein, partial [Tanacetum coccineum]
MSVQFSSNQIELHFPNPEKSLQFCQDEESESENIFHDSIQGEDENAEDIQMVDHLRPMEELLRIPIVGIEDVIVVPAVLADQFELKPELLDFVRAAETWLENEPPCSITTWDDLVSKFLNRFYPHSKTRELRKEIMNFQQDFGETFTEAWERFKDLLRKYALTIIENKARVRTCKNKPQVSSSGGTSTQIDAITALTKQVEALEYHFASMRETYDQNQEAAVQLMQNQMGQMADFQERPLGEFPSNTRMNLPAELKVITSSNGLTLDGSFLPHSNFLVYQENEQELETIMEMVEIPSSQSTPLVPPPETPPLSAPKSKEDPKPNPYQPPIPYPCRLQEENFQALKNLTGRADHDIVDSLCDTFHIENNSLSGSPNFSPDTVVESLSPSLTPPGEIDLLLEESDTFLSQDDSIPSDLPPKELKDDEPSTTKSLFEKPLKIDNEIYDSEGDILFLENLLKDEPSKADKSEIYTLIGEPPDTFLMEDVEIKLNPLKDSDDSVPIPRVSVTPLDSIDSILDSYDTSYTNPSDLDSESTLNYGNPIFKIQNEHCDDPETETIMDE